MPPKKQHSVQSYSYTHLLSHVTKHQPTSAPEIVLLVGPLKPLTASFTEVQDGYCCWKWSPMLKSEMMMFVFHFVLMPLRKAWIHLYSPHFSYD